MGGWGLSSDTHFAKFVYLSVPRCCFVIGNQCFSALDRAPIENFSSPGQSMVIIIVCSSMWKICFFPVRPMARETFGPSDTGYKPPLIAGGWDGKSRQSFQF